MMHQSLNSLHPIKMSVDKYLNDSDRVQELEAMGCDVYPVDMNGIFVSTDKLAGDNLEKTEESIENRLGV